MKRKLLIGLFSISILIFAGMQLLVGVVYNPIIYVEKNRTDFIHFVEKKIGSKFDKIEFHKEDKNHLYFIYRNGMFTNFNYITYYKFKINKKNLTIKEFEDIYNENKYPF